MKIIAFPRDPNPYQELLYTPMREKGVSVAYLEGPTSSQTLNLLCMPFALLRRRIGGATVFHLHWTYLFTLPWAHNPFGQRIMGWYFAFMLRLIKLYGYKLVWTAHNVLPHAPQFANDVSARRLLAYRADSIIAHSQSAKDQLVRVVSALPSKITVIPHGNYQDVYPNTVPRDEARDSLLLPKKAFVALFLGKIETYKNIPALLDTALAIPELHVVVAGSCNDAALTRRLRAYEQKLGKRLQLHFGYVPEARVQYFYNAADVTVLPFSEVSTSGSVLLSLTFGTPIIAPRLGGLNDVPNTVGYLYDPEQTDALERTLRAAMRGPLTAKRRGAYRYVASLSWTRIAATTEKLLRR